MTHPVLQQETDRRSFGEKIADTVAGGMGSWRFIIIQSIIVVLWIIGNVWFLIHPFDKYPFILLNLVFSTQASYAAPVIMMSQNRAAKKDALLAAHHYDETKKIDALITANNKMTEQIHKLTTTLSKAQKQVSIAKAKKESS